MNTRFSSPPANSVKLISTDFDGTIHDELAIDAIFPELQDSLSRWQAQGGIWVINTGRDLDSLEATARRASMKTWPDYVVAVEREIYRRQPSGDYSPVEPWHSRCHADHQFLFSTHRHSIESLLARLQTQFRATLYSDPWSPICVIANDIPEMDAIERELRQFCDSIPELIPMRNHIYCRLSQRGYHKGTALAEIARLEGLKPLQILAAGDHLNDLPMLDRTYAHWLVTPANGMPPVLARVRDQEGFLAAERVGRGIWEALLAWGIVARK